MSQSPTTWTPDASQQAVINIERGWHLVLAPPGCGKTQILAERVGRALKAGISGSDMLCLTFTNRAARGMNERIGQAVADRGKADIFVGNIHRFCARYLFDRQLIDSDTAIIDDDDIISILARYLNDDEEIVAKKQARRRAYQAIVFFSHFMADLEHGREKELRMHSECVTKDDVAVMRAIAEATGRPFDAKLMQDIYDHTDHYRGVTEQENFPPELRDAAGEMLEKMKYAHAFVAYKRQRHLVDFEDLLQFTYADLMARPDHQRYRWVQVDEVQDLNLLQLAIIEELVGQGDDACALFLGDEQQAIFSFMGAKLTTLNTLKQRCGTANIHHLNVNHRSPRRLVEMLNAYAVANLNTDAALLPQPLKDRYDRPGKCKMSIRGYDNIWAETNAVAKLAEKLLKDNPTERTAIIVNANHDADDLSKALDKLKTDHFKISGTDIFSLPAVKLLFAHLGVLDNDRNFLAWARILSGMKAMASPSSARWMVHRLRERAMSPSDFLTGDEPYTERFVRAYEAGDIVVFDTETTGLNVFDDDIVQIAAVRLRQGKVVEQFSVYIDSDRSLPEKLGDTENPMIGARKHERLYSHQEGLYRFLDFVGDNALLAHNAAFDWHIVDCNLRRYLDDDTWPTAHSVCFDSLKLARMLNPGLKHYRLKDLIAELGLSGSNTHLADDDVAATVSLVNDCYAKALAARPSQRQFLAREDTKHCLDWLRRNYKPYYDHALARLYDRKAAADGVPALVDELRWFYHELEQAHWIEPVGKIDYVFRFLARDVIHEQEEPSLIEQLNHHIVEINTFKEADLCSSKNITDRLFVSTIHKAKGLEFDNVIVFDVADGRIPSFFHEGKPTMMAEDARKLYVAMSRAMHRLFITYARQTPTTRGFPDRKPSRFLEPVKAMFEEEKQHHSRR